MLLIINYNILLSLVVLTLLLSFVNVIHCDINKHENTQEIKDDDNSSSIKNIPPEMISSDPNDVKFFIYPDNNNPDYKQRIIPWDIVSLQQSDYNTSIPLKVLIHGFMSNSTDINGFIDRIKSAYFHVKIKANIISVDWGHLSTVKDRLPLLPYYHSAVKNVQMVGKLVAEFLIFLIENNFLKSPIDVHLIGFSLGSHVCGVAGYIVLQNTSIPIHRITGLDPAGPAFKNLKGRDLKLDSTDASFVDITHTNQGENGYNGILGHVDFYPNGGGPNQHSCMNATEPVKAVAGLCAHSYAYKLYAESIKSENVIRACKCDSSMMMNVPCSSLDETTCQPSAIFGEYCRESARGKFYFNRD